MSLSVNVYNKDQFRRASLNGAVEFNLKLTQGKAPLVLKKCLRIVSGKRIVAVADWKGQSVIAKIFFKRLSASRHLNKEVAGLAALKAAELPAPKVLLESVCEHDADIKVLLLERLVGAETFDECVALNPSQRDHCYGQMLKLLACMHAKGVQQSDFHLDNFLIAKGVFYIIDAAELKFKKREISASKSLLDLVTLFSQLRITNPAMQQAWYARYAALRNWEYDDKVAKGLLKLFAKQHMKRFSESVKRVESRSKHKIKQDANRQLIVVREFLNDEMLGAIKHISGEASISLGEKEFNVSYFSKKAHAKKTWEAMRWLQFSNLAGVTPVALVTVKSKSENHFVVWL